MKRIALFIFSFLLVATISQAQTKKENSKQDNAYAPFSPEEVKKIAKAPTKRIKKKNKKNPYARYEMTYEQKIKEFEERMEANAKKYKKNLKKSQKPQYSDPSYFGHKRKPKIRKVGKRKFCKECGIVH